MESVRFYTSTGYLVLNVLFLIHPLVQCTDEVSMNSRCGETITVSADDQIKLVFEFYSNTQFYDGNCSVIIASADKTMMYFSKFDVSCDDGHLSVTEAFTNDVIYGWSRLCDVHVDESDVFVAEDNIIITFHANRLHHVSNGVTVILTGFTDEVSGTCPSGAHTCDNGRCINDDFYCNGYNSCGIQSDCPTEDEIDVVGTVIGSVIAVLIVVGCFGTGIFFCKRMMCRGMKSTPTVAYSSNRNAQPPYPTHIEPSYPANSAPPVYCPQGQAQFGFQRTPDVPKTDSNPTLHVVPSAPELPPPYEENWSSQYHNSNTNYTGHHYTGGSGIKGHL